MRKTPAKLCNDKKLKYVRYADDFLIAVNGSKADCEMIRIIAVQTCEDGYDYTLLDENYNEIDGGQVDNPELSMIEVRQDILESFGLERRELRAMFYEEVMEQMFENGRLAVDAPEKRESVMEKLMQTGEKAAPSSHSHKPKEPER